MLTQNYSSIARNTLAYCYAVGEVRFYALTEERAKEKAEKYALKFGGFIQPVSLGAGYGVRQHTEFSDGKTWDWFTPYDYHPASGKNRWSLK